MDEARLASAVESLVGERLARDLARDFLKLRGDVSSGLLERASAGKFVESYVQCLRRITRGQSAATTEHIDHYLKNQAEHETSLPEGLRICGTRIARSIYSMRNKRNIAHKAEIDPNRTDLELTYHGATWIMAELIRSANGVTMEEAAALTRLVSAPVGTLVEEIDGVRMVHANVSLRVEILLLLHSHHPDPVTSAQLCKWTGKAPSVVRSRLSELRKQRLIVGDGSKGCRLTSPGYSLAVHEVQRLQT